MKYGQQKKAGGLKKLFAVVKDDAGRTGYLKDIVHCAGAGHISKSAPFLKVQACGLNGHGIIHMNQVTQ